MIEYEQRDAVLRGMGFTSYQAYLDSRRWKRIRARVLKKTDRCWCCGSQGTEVHHRDYSPKTLAGKSLDGLVLLCGTCHNLAEFGGEGIKGRLSEANHKIDMLASLDRTPISSPMTDSEWWRKRNEAKKAVRASIKTEDRKSSARKKTNKRKEILKRIPPELLPDHIAARMVAESKPRKSKAKAQTEGQLLTKGNGISRRA